MAFSDWYEVLDLQNSGGQSILNVYHVERVDIGQDAQQIFNAFEVSILPTIVTMQSSTVTHTEVSVRSLDNPFDFFSATPAGNVGLKGGDTFAQFNAAAIQFIRTRIDMKNGQKRFIAGIETDSTGASWNAAFLVQLDAVGDALIAPWQVGAPPGVDVCRYGILKRVCTVEPPPDPCPSYRLPEDDAELEFFIPVSFVSRDRIRSQVSRKRLV